MLSASERLMSWNDQFEVPIVASRSANGQGSHIDFSEPLAERIVIGIDTDIVVARQRGRAIATSMKFSATDSAFIATTISELARALLAHSVRGEIWLHRVDDGRRSGVVILARDPQVRDSTGSHRAFTFDCDFPDVCRLVDEFDVASEAGQGTIVRAAKWRRQR